MIGTAEDGKKEGRGERRTGKNRRRKRAKENGDRGKKKIRKKLNEQKLIQIDVSDYPLARCVPEVSLST